jgi:hypothetical protein
MPAWVLIVQVILSGLPALIQAVESIAGAVQGQGAVKKQAVLDVAGAVVDAVSALPGNTATAAQKPAIIGLTGAAVDTLVGAYNAAGAFAHPPPLVVDPGGNR